MARALHSTVIGLCLANAALAGTFHPRARRLPVAVDFPSFRAGGPGQPQPSRFWPAPPGAVQPSHFWQAPPGPKQPSFFMQTPTTPPKSKGVKEFTVNPEKIIVRESDLRRAMRAAEKLAADHGVRAQPVAPDGEQAKGPMVSKAVASETTDVKATEQEQMVSKAAKEAVLELKAKMDQDKENEGMVRRAANEAAGAALRLMRKKDDQTRLQARSSVRRAALQHHEMQQKSVRTRRNQSPPQHHKRRPQRQTLRMKKQSTPTHHKKQRESAHHHHQASMPSAPRQAPAPRRGPKADYPAAAADVAKEVALKAYSRAPTAPGVTQAAQRAVLAASAAHRMSAAKQRFEEALHGGGPNAQRGKWMDQMTAQAELSQAIQQLSDRRGAQLEVALPPFRAAPLPPQAPPMAMQSAGAFRGAFPRRYLVAPEAQPAELVSDPVEEEEDEEEEEEDTPMTKQSVGTFKAFPRRYTIESQRQPAQFMADQDPSMARGGLGALKAFPHKYMIETENQPAPLTADPMSAPLAAPPAITLDVHQRSYGGPPPPPRETELMGAPPKFMPL